jgi:hypothetical protein
LILLTVGGAMLPLVSVPTSAAPSAVPADPALEQQMDLAWTMVWTRFYQPKVQTFADYLSSYEAGHEQDHLPKAEEVQRQYPNPCGYGTGMEDGMILGGAMLSILADRFEVTGEDELRRQSRQVFEGMRRCVSVHGVPGFVARNVCPEDGQSVYINSSRDQYTHFVHGLWKYYHSPLSDEQTRDEIRPLLVAVADRMLEFVTPENDYDFCRADGQHCPLRICRMWNVQAHEAARLPMIYAAAWDVSHEERYRAAWRKYAAEAIEQSASPDGNKPAYALLQMQCSLELLAALEPEEPLREKILAAMRHVADLSQVRVIKVSEAIARKTPEEMRMLGPDWRTVAVWKNQKGYQVPQWGAYREIWHLTRELGEAAIVPLMLPAPQMTPEQKQRLTRMLSSFDYAHNSSCGLVYHVGAYWKARRHGLL